MGIYFYEVGILNQQTQNSRDISQNKIPFNVHNNINMHKYV